MIYFISDLHLDHYNIIRYCNRPFHSVKEMNSVLINNWNRIVSPDDLIYFLGDMSFGRNSRNALYWLSKLNGNKVCIKGSHDNGLKADPFRFIQVRGERVLLIHNPYNAPLDWAGWIMHGHVHNTQPFLDRNRKRINVSVEAINYRPVSLDTIASILEER